MRKTRKEYTDANRVAWDEAAAKHAAHNNEALFAAAGDPDFVSFDLDYYAHETYDSLPNYSFMHRLDEILMAVIACDLQLSRFVELDYDISNFCSDLEHSPLKPPLGFVMVMNAQ